MTPYQRGNRDGLLSFAKACDTEAQAERDEVARWERSRHAHSARASENHAFARQALMHAAALARRMAEALPVDPEPSVLACGHPAQCYTPTGCGWCAEVRRAAEAGAREAYLDVANAIDAGALPLSLRSSLHTASTGPNAAIVSRVLARLTPAGGKGEG